MNMNTIGAQPVLSSDRFEWTDAEDAFLTEHQDWSAQKIADELHRTSLSVRGRRHKLGLGSPPRRWSDEDVTALTEMVSAGMTHKEAADVLDRTVPAVHRRCQMLGLSFSEIKPWTASEDAKLRRAVESGAAFEATARELGRSVSSLHYRRAKLGLPLVHQPWTDEDDELLIRERKNGKSASEVADLLGRSESAVLNRINRIREVRRQEDS